MESINIVRICVGGGHYREESPLTELIVTGLHSLHCDTIPNTQLLIVMIFISTLSIIELYYKIINPQKEDKTPSGQGHSILKEILFSSLFCLCTNILLTWNENK